MNGSGDSAEQGAFEVTEPIERRISVRATECVFRYKQIVVKKCHRYTQIWLNTQTTLKNAFNPQVFICYHLYVVFLKCVLKDFFLIGQIKTVRQSQFSTETFLHQSLNFHGWSYSSHSFAAWKYSKFGIKNILKHITEVTITYTLS